MQPFANLDKRVRGTRVKHKFDLTRLRAQKFLNMELAKDEGKRDPKLLERLMKVLKGE